MKFKIYDLRFKIFYGFFGILGILGILTVLPTAYLCVFTKQAGVKKTEVLNQIWSGIRNPYKEKYLTFLILGLDKRETESTLLTDTMILATINAETGNSSLFSIPRDLWLDDLKTKINALYYYGQKLNPSDGTEMVRGKVEEIFDLKINFVAVLGMKEIAELIDSLGGIEVSVERSFTDEEFPKDDGSGEVTTVTFISGSNHFNGEKALQFMRSRKSKDEVEGTDMARQERQKQVIIALKNKLINSKKTFLDPGKTARLYQFLISKIKINPRIDLKVLASFWKIGLKVSKGQQKETGISWQGEKALLVDGRDPVYNSWILKPKEDNWSLLREYFKESLP